MNSTSLLNVDGVRYLSLEHAYQAIKAKMVDCESLFHRIRLAPTPQMAKRFAASLPTIPKAKLHDLMKTLLLKKAEQCYSFRSKLRSTAAAPIYHSTYRDVDTFWCTGLDHRDVDGHRLGKYPGLNMLGPLFIFLSF